MAETIATTPETNETIPEKEEKAAEITPAAPEPTADAAPKKRGRPRGAPDKAPRKKKANRQTVIEKANAELALDSHSSNMIAAAPMRRRRKVGERPQGDLVGDGDLETLGDQLSDI